MTKQMSITLSDWVFDTYLQNVGKNRSKFIEGMFVKGFELECGDFDSQKQRLLEAKKLLDEKDSIINQLKAQAVDKKSKKIPISELNEKELNILKGCKERIDKNPNIMKGNFELFKNSFGKKITLEQFKDLLSQLETKEEIVTPKIIDTSSKTSSTSTLATNFDIN